MSRRWQRGRGGRSVADVAAARRLRPLTVAVAVVAALMWVYAAQVPGGHSRWVPALLVAFALTEATQLHVELRRQTMSLSLSEIPLLLGLFLVSPLQLLACRMAACVLVATLRRTAPYKMCFNLATFGLELATVVLLFRFLVGQDSPGPRLWLACYVCILVATLLSGTAVLAAITRLQGPPGGAEIGSMYAPLLLSAGLNTSAALLGWLVAQEDVRALPILLVLGGAVAVGYRAYSTLLGRHAVLGLMHRFTEEVSGTDGVAMLTEQVLEHLRRLLTADHAELVLVTAGGPGSARRSGSLRPAVEVARPVLAVRNTRDPALARWLAGQGLKDAVAVPLHGEDALLGHLLVGDRLGEMKSFTSKDVQLLELIAAHVSICLRNGELVDRLRHDAGHDALTGLPNRGLFRERLDDVMSEAAGQERVAVLLMDLDGFKDVNDTLGHHTGDGLLRQVATRLRSVLPEPVTVARLGGDEFAFVSAVGADLDQAMNVAAVLQEALRHPFELDGVTLEVRASLGVAIYPDHAQDADVLLQHADVAMYAAKATRQSVVMFNHELDRSSPRRLALIAELRQAVEGGELVCHYQPKLDLRSGTTPSVEVLVRWQHPTLGLIPPDDFIPIAEHTGLILALTSQVLATSLQVCAQWRDAGRPLGVAVNVSPRGLLSPDFVGEVRRALERAGVPAELLTLEITESGVMSDPERARAVLHELHALGVRLSIDDFGTGYSSLAYLVHLPVDEVKIDKSFVLTLATSPRNAAVVRAIVELGHTLGLSVVAEGVEDLRAQEILTAAGCDVAQGFLISRPVPRDVLDAWLTPTRLGQAPGVSAPRRLAVAR